MGSQPARCGMLKILLLTTHLKQLAVFCSQTVEEQLEDEDSEDVYIFSKVADIIHSLFLAYRLNFYPYFDQIVGHFVKCLVSWLKKKN